MKPVILFVDDEPNILDGLRRFTRGQRHAWDMHFADGGAAAPETVAREPVDVVVCDMRMPGIAGADVLERISRCAGHHPLHPVGEAEPEQVYRAVGRSHRFFGKPCDPEALIAAIEAPLALIREIGSDVAERGASFLDRLQSPPAAFDALGKLLERPGAQPADVAAIVARDPSLAVRLLQLVNSAYFGRPVETCNIARALDAIGLDRLRALLVRRRLGNNGGQTGASPPQHERAWRLADRAAALAVAAGVAPADSDVVYAAALFARLGQRETPTGTFPPIAAPSAAYATTLLGLPARLTEALRRLAQIPAAEGDLDADARAVCVAALPAPRIAA
ncbi:MAG: HDOD domain-containing protein [Alphaproteobacteria bacterium]